MGWSGWSKRVRIVVLAAIAIAVLGGAGTAVALKASSDRAEDRRQEAIARKAEEQRAAAAERERAQRQQEKADASYEREVRKFRTSLIHRLRKNLTADARKMVQDGYIAGPVLSTSCENSDGKETDLEAENGAYECLTVSVRHDDGTASGYSFKARINYENGSSTWRYEP